MSSAEYGRVWKTYRHADNSLIIGEYEFMTEPDCFENDDGDDYLEVVEETWQLIGSKILKYGRTDTWCHTCEEEFTLPEPAPFPHYYPEHIDGSSDGGS